MDKDQDKAFSIQLLAYLERVQCQYGALNENLGRIVGGIKMLSAHQQQEPTRGDLLGEIQRLFKDHDSCCAKRAEGIDENDAERGGHLVDRAMKELCEARKDVLVAVAKADEAAKKASETQKSFEALKVWFVVTASVGGAAVSYLAWALTHMQK